MKIVINDCHGGFSLSREAFLELRKIGNKYAKEEPDIGEYWDYDPDGEQRGFMNGKRYDLLDDDFLVNIPRDDLDLIKIVKQLGKKANGDCASLKIVEIPNDVEWEISEHAGIEWIAEKHRTWC